MKAAIESRFRMNIARVRNLTDIYRNHFMGSGPGRRDHSKTDVLRSAVVMLHAAMEDLLRSIAYWKLPAASPQVLSKIPLVSTAPAVKFNLGDLSIHRGKTVDEVIESSVNGYLERSNYNNTNEVASFLESVGIDVHQVNSHFSNIEPVMKRRHQIVHRADQDDSAAGRGHHRVTSIGVGTVENWISSIEAFGNAVLNEI